MTDLQTIIIVSHTHWDREWYATFQQFRFRLIGMMDRLLGLLLERSDYVHFLLDGQSVLLEDYLAIRPERAEDVRHLVESGRLGIGPWYVQPDEFLVSGEALIRNLLLGHQVAASLGGAIKVAWLPDTFGHVAQLPQLLLDFQIDTFVTSRGLGEHLERPVLEFWWEAPNGSRVLALHQEGGYWNAGNLGYPYFWGDTRRCEVDARMAVAKVRRLANKLSPHAASPTIAIWNGADHMPPQESLLDLIPCLNAELEDYTVEHGRVEDYATAVRRAGSKLPLVSGELRGSGCQNLHAPVLSARMYLKQANHRTQRLLERYAEPLAAVAWLAGEAHPDAQLWEAWRLLLRNHPHDSICGCSIDQVHREMMSRFQQAQQIGDCVVASAFEALARRVDSSWCCPEAVPMVVFNPLARERQAVIESTLRLPERQGYQVVDHQGTLRPTEVLAEHVETYAWMDREEAAADVSSQIPFWRQCLRALDGLDIVGFEWRRREGGVALFLRLADWPFGSDRVVEQLRAELGCRSPDERIKIEASYVVVKLAFLADLPPCGYATYAIRASDRPQTGDSHVQGSDRSLENKHLRVDVGADGRLSLIDKRTGHRFADLHRIEDVADRGDCYDFCPLTGSDDEGATLGDRAEVKMMHAGDLVKSLVIRGGLRVPQSLDDNRRSRSTKHATVPVTTLLKLKAGTRYLEVLTELDNRARDHRLRVLFPTRIESDVVHADGHFALATRPAVPTAGEDWHQPPSNAQPHHTWFGTDDGGTGLAVLSEGLPEHAGLPSCEGLTLALTLLRSVGWLSRGDLSTRKGHSGPAIRTPDAQCLGPHSFRYGVLPYQGDPVTATVPFQASAFGTPPVVQLTEPGAGEFSPRQSIVSLQPSSLILTALKRSDAGDRLLMRFYSVDETAVEATIRFGFRVTEAHRATASERIIETLELAPDRSACELEVGPAEIVTILLRFDLPLQPVELNKEASV